MDQSDETVSLREQSLSEKDIDRDYIGNLAVESWRKTTTQRQDFMQRREAWTASWRDMRAMPRTGPFPGSSNFHIPLALTYGKAFHARLWQLFSDPDFFGVAARREAFADKEQTIRDFMRYVLESYANFGQGTRAVWDEFLWDDVFDGSAYLKLYWGRDKHTYKEVIPKVTVQQSLVFDAQNPTGREKTDVLESETEEVRTEIRESPQIKRLLLEDVILPIGQSDPQTADFAVHRLSMNDYYLKMRAQDGKFYRDTVEEVIQHKTNVFMQPPSGTEIKQDRADMDGYDTTQSEPEHIVLEWYGKAYIKADVDEEEVQKDVDTLPEEIVAWVHVATKKVLGWTYLYRISPDGTRPIFKTDLVHFPDRSTGVGVPEMLQDTQDAIDSNYNIRADNGILSSMPIGFYRASSGLKPDTIRYEPGTFYPVDDVNDVSIKQFPFLANYGYTEEERLNGYAERLLAMDELQLGRAPTKVGIFRNATSANTLSEASNIQLEIHFDRIARTLSQLLSSLFKMCRERMPGELYFRVMGEDGRPVFGQVSREDLKGDFDFIINVDVLASSRQELQQQAIMMSQMLINPAFTQTGVVTPSNIYAIAKQVLRTQRIKGIANYITPPPNYTGPVLTPQERLHKIVVGDFVNPAIEDTVRMDENHEEALKIYEGFKTSPYAGLLHSPEQVAALVRLEQAHMRMEQAVQAGGNPNMSGMQLPRQGFTPIGAPGAGNAALSGQPQGEANGPVVS